MSCHLDRRLFLFFVLGRLISQKLDFDQLLSELLKLRVLHIDKLFVGEDVELQAI